MKHKDYIGGWSTWSEKVRRKTFLIEFKCDMQAERTQQKKKCGFGGENATKDENTQYDHDPKRYVNTCDTQTDMLRMHETCSFNFSPRTKCFWISACRLFFSFDLFH